MDRLEVYKIAKNIYDSTHQSFKFAVKNFMWGMSQDIFDLLSEEFSSNENEEITLFGLCIEIVEGKEILQLKWKY